MCREGGAGEKFIDTRIIWNACRIRIRSEKDDTAFSTSQIKVLVRSVATQRFHFAISFWRPVFVSKLRRVAHTRYESIK